MAGRNCFHPSDIARQRWSCESGSKHSTVADTYYCLRTYCGFDLVDRIARSFAGGHADEASLRGFSYFGANGIRLDRDGGSFSNAHFVAPASAIYWEILTTNPIRSIASPDV